MKERNIQIIFVYLYHAFFILLGFMLMQEYVDGLLTTAVIADIVYVLYWLIFNINRERHMPWIVYLHFVSGSAIEIILNLFGIIPEDSGWFAGLGQFFYILLLLIHATLIGIINLALWLKSKKVDSKKIIIIIDGIFIVLTMLCMGYSGSMFFLMIEIIILIIACAKMGKEK